MNQKDSRHVFTDMYVSHNMDHTRDIILSTHQLLLKE